jgi:hypothetical protein
MEFRFYAAEISEPYVTRACQFAARHACLFVDNRSRRVMKPDVAAVMNGIRRSTVRRFVEDPASTLTNLPEISVPKIEMSKIDAPARLARPPSKLRRFCAWLVGAVRIKREADE